MCLSECRKAALVDSRLDIAISNTFEIHHRRGDIAVSHPLLQCADVDSVLEMPSGIRVAKLVEEPPPAIRPIGTAMHIHRFSVFQLVSHNTVSAIEFGAKCWPACCRRHGPGS
jgi:hypothetical protein